MVRRKRKKIRERHLILYTKLNGIRYYLKSPIEEDIPGYTTLFNHAYKFPDTDKTIEKSIRLGLHCKQFITRPV